MKLGTVNMAYFKVSTCLPLWLFVNSFIDVMTNEKCSEFFTRNLNTSYKIWQEDEQVKTGSTQMFQRTNLIW